MTCNCDDLIVIDRKAVYNGERVEFQIMQQCVKCGKVWCWRNV